MIKGEIYSLIIGLNGIVDRGSTIELQKMERLVSEKKIVEFLNDEFERNNISYSIEDSKEIIQNELLNAVNFFDTGEARTHYLINENGYLMLVNALVTLVREDKL
ncbi:MULTISPECIES: hypothetical protein [unclassified Clostridioides]|uniref:hypothetical protein n=1 Tax=unclassified Clostridioides TaxID=2635829 RepID=UPI001C19A454|nr:hypothetical protein [Clostridioides sp. ZZV14-6105]MCC0732872.1 hypothetical protein [Clostridioides sp. ZZV14-6048]MCC0753047.1 hypothetical protein [Clostridioides sp. ZZV13-5731]HBF2188902.1 hypothetical protein [Clostridioides difficile]HBF8463800.1 hypothetical protein [Clostridioides difficile]